MAIPFNLPSDEETEDNYRRLDQLLLDLYHVLRQILLRSGTSTNTDGDGEEGATAAATAPSRSRPVGDVSDPRRHRLDPNLPDVVSSTLDCHCQPSRRRQRRHRRRRNCCHNQNRDHREQSHQRHNSTTTLAQVSRPSAPGICREAPRRQDNWLVVGEHLRKIAEEFKTSLRKEECADDKEQSLQLQVKTSGLFSLLVPSHFRNSLWTTVILLVGWRLLARTR